MRMDLISLEAQIQLEKMMRLFNIPLVYDDDSIHVRDWQGENMGNLASFLGMKDELPSPATMEEAISFKRRIYGRLGGHTMKKIDPACNDFDVIDELNRRLKL